MTSNLPWSKPRSPTFKNITSVKFISVLHGRKRRPVVTNHDISMCSPKKETITSLELQHKQRRISNIKFDKRLAKWLRQRSTTRVERLQDWRPKRLHCYVYVAISGCRSLLQSPGVSLLELCRLVRWLGVILCAIRCPPPHFDSWSWKPVIQTVHPGVKMRGLLELSSYLS